MLIRRLSSSATAVATRNGQNFRIRHVHVYYSVAALTLAQHSSAPYLSLSQSPKALTLLVRLVEMAKAPRKPLD